MLTSTEKAPGVDFDPASMRAETISFPEGNPGARFSVKLRGPVDLAWIRSLYLIQWQGLDYLDYHLSESCREIYFDCAEPEQELPVKLSVLKNLLCLVGREASSERGIQAA